MKTNKDDVNKESSSRSSNERDSDNFSDFDSCEGEYETKIPKFNLEEFEKRNQEHKEFLRSQVKGRRGIGNYDTYCACFEKESNRGSSISLSNKSTK